MNTRWNIAVVSLMLLATLAGFGYVLSIWSVGYSPRWTPGDNKYQYPNERFGFPDITLEGQFRLVFSPAWGDTSLITVTPTETGAEVSAETYYGEWAEPPLLESYERTISRSMYQDLVRQLYALDIFDRNPTEDVFPAADGRGVHFMAIVDDRYIWFDSNIDIPELVALESLFRSVCGDRCDADFLGDHNHIPELRRRTLELLEEAAREKQTPDSD
ncbi:MAG: hypothetical protein AAFN07_07665 [Pseudomonadota bacterium]